MNLWQFHVPSFTLFLREKMEMVTFCARLSMYVRCITIWMVVLTFWWCYLEEGFGGRWWAWIGKHSLGRPSVIEERLPLKNEAIYSLELDCLHLCCPIPTTPWWSCRYKMGKFPSWGKQVLPTSGKVSLRGGKGGGRCRNLCFEGVCWLSEPINQSVVSPSRYPTANQF